MKKILAFALCGAVIFSSCSSLNNAVKGTAIGASGGAIAGAALGYLIGGDVKSAAIGAAAGTAVGGTTGAIIGNKMDKKAEELAALEAAKVETFEINGLQAIRVTFENGILFNTNSTTISPDAQKSLQQFAEAMTDLPDTDITIWGHADKTGTAEYNQKISQQRADAVEKTLKAAGLKNKIVAEGKSFDLPIASNETVEGRAQNRRVEVYVTANENMIKAAEAGTLK